MAMRPGYQQGGFQNCSPKNARENFDKSFQKSHECSRAFSYLEKKIMNAREHFPIWKKKRADFQFIYFCPLYINIVY